MSTQASPQLASSATATATAINASMATTSQNLSITPLSRAAAPARLGVPAQPGEHEDDGVAGDPVRYRRQCEDDHGLDEPDRQPGRERLEPGEREDRDRERGDRGRHPQRLADPRRARLGVRPGGRRRLRPLRRLRRLRRLRPLRPLRPLRRPRRLPPAPQAPRQQQEDESGDRAVGDQAVEHRELARDLQVPRGQVLDEEQRAHHPREGQHPAVEAARTLAGERGEPPAIGRVRREGGAREPAGEHDAGQRAERGNEAVGGDAPLGGSREQDREGRDRDERGAARPWPRRRGPRPGDGAGTAGSRRPDRARSAAASGAGREGRARSPAPARGPGTTRRSVQCSTPPDGSHRSIGASIRASTTPSACGPALPSTAHDNGDGPRSRRSRAERSRRASAMRAVTCLARAEISSACWAWP